MFHFNGDGKEPVSVFSYARGSSVWESTSNQGLGGRGGSTRMIGSGKVGSGKLPK